MLYEVITNKFFNHSRWAHLIVVILILFTAGSVLAAKPSPVPDGTGLLTGKVTVAGTRTAIVGASVTALGSAGTFTAVTNTKGSYSMASYNFV